MNTFIPPESPEPGWSSGEVCRLTTATRGRTPGGLVGDIPTMVRQVSSNVPPEPALGLAAIARRAQSEAHHHPRAAIRPGAGDRREALELLG
jgi:hypothetical protein